MQGLADAAHATSAVNSVLTFLAAYWWLWWLFGASIVAAIGAFFGGVRDYFLEIGERRHQRRLELIRARRDGQQAIGAREDGSLATVAPRDLRAGPCRHRPKNVKAVIGADGLLKAWLCEACDTPLPANWAVLEEDL
jgi:hypothetical protein